MGIYKEIRFDGHTVLVGFPQEKDLEKLKAMGYQVIVDIEPGPKPLAQWAERHDLKYIPLEIGQCDFSKCDLNDQRILDWLNFTDQLKEPYILSTHDEALGVLLVIIHQALCQGHGRFWIEDRFQSLGYGLRPDLRRFLEDFWAHYGIKRV
ncbi:hypothetical protein [Thermosulfuriphilus sp.]